MSTNRRTSPDDMDWPKAGDSLFARGDDWEMDAALDASPDALLDYALSYKEAADATVEQIESGGSGKDSLVYPVFYLYRHFVELMLKGLIRMGRTLARDKPEYPTHHRIYDLWRECRPILERAFPDGDRQADRAVEGCLREIARVDPTGEGFRYAEDKGGRPIQHPVRSLNLGNVRGVMSRMAGYFIGSYDALDALVQAQNDLGSHFGESG